MIITIIAYINIYRWPTDSSDFNKKTNYLNNINSNQNLEKIYKYATQMQMCNANANVQRKCKYAYDRTTMNAPIIARLPKLSTGRSDHDLD